MAITRSKAVKKHDDRKNPHAAEKELARRVENNAQRGKQVWDAEQGTWVRLAPEVSKA